MGLDVHDAYMNMAIDEAICRLRSEGKSINTIRLYRWKPSAVTIGYFQLVDQEVNLNTCERIGVDVTRRMTGGGAVYHAFEGEITYSIIVNQDHQSVPSDILESYEVICRGIVNALKEIEINAEFKPVNDIDVNGKKISGNAQTRRGGVLLQHGTILVDTDIKTMFKVLKVSKEKISDKMITAVEERVTTLRRELRRRVDFEEITDVLKKNLPKVFDVDTYEGGLTPEEMDLAKKLKKDKYSSLEWIYNRPNFQKSVN